MLTSRKSERVDDTDWLSSENTPLPNRWYLQLQCRHQTWQFSTMFENNRKGPNLVKIAVHMVSWGLPRHIVVIYIKSNY
jgi:hypothetical protein